MYDVYSELLIENWGSTTGKYVAVNEIQVALRKRLKIYIKLTETELVNFRSVFCTFIAFAST